MCPHRSNCPQNTKKRKKNFKKSTNLPHPPSSPLPPQPNISLNVQRWLKIYLWSLKTPTFTALSFYQRIIVKKPSKSPILIGLTRKNHGINPICLGGGTMCPPRSNCPQNTKKRKKFFLKSTNLPHPPSSPLPPQPNILLNVQRCLKIYLWSLKTKTFTALSFYQRVFVKKP